MAVEIGANSGGEMAVEEERGLLRIEERLWIAAASELELVDLENDGEEEEEVVDEVVVRLLWWEGEEEDLPHDCWEGESTMVLDLVGRY